MLCVAGTAAGFRFGAIARAFARTRENSPVAQAPKDKAPRIALIHATVVSMDPTEEAFRKLWPEAETFHLLDSSLVGERCNRCAVSMAQDTGSKLYALCPHDSGSKEHDVVRTHTKRMARIHGIEVVEDIVKGDPTIEFVQKVRAKANQLVVINWNCITLRRDMLIRIINDSDASVLVVGREGRIEHTKEKL